MDKGTLFVGMLAGIALSFVVPLVFSVVAQVQREREEWEYIHKAESTWVAAECLDLHGDENASECRRRCQSTARPNACNDWVSQWVARRKRPHATLETLREAIEHANRLERKPTGKTQP